MRLHRFYVSQPLGEEVVIEDVPTIKQWLKVFRYISGDSVIIFNGDGSEYTYTLQETSSTRCILSLSQKNPTYIPKRKSYLFISVIKKDLFEFALEKAIELGVTDIVPVITERTEKKLLNYERLTTIIKEASEQSGRGDLLTLHETISLEKAYILASEKVSQENVFIATLFGTPLKEVVRRKNSLTEDSSASVAFFIGPEGGWSDSEETTFKEKGFTRVSLGETTLRAETAAITAAVVISLF